MNRLLAVEDSQDNFDLIAEALGDQYTVLHACTGTEGLTKASTLNPDAILLDLELPDLDGLEVVGRLKALPTTARIPVIALTAHAMKGHREHCLSAGCDAYLAKPICIEELSAVVAAHLAAPPKHSPRCGCDSVSCNRSVEPLTGRMP